MDKFENTNVNKIELNTPIENTGNKIENWLGDIEKKVTGEVTDNKIEVWLNQLETDLEVQEKLESFDKIEFGCPEHLDKDEFERQLKDQQDGINDLTIDEWITNRQNYIENGRVDTTFEQTMAKDELYWDFVDDCIENGDSYEEALAKANTKRQESDALHAPDQIAGGDRKSVV